MSIEFNRHLHDQEQAELSEELRRAEPKVVMELLNEIKELDLPEPYGPTIRNLALYAARDLMLRNEDRANG